MEAPGGQFEEARASAPSGANAREASARGAREAGARGAREAGARRASETGARGAREAREKIPHPDTGALDLATIMRTLGDPVRLDIVRLLSDDQPRICNDISAEMGLPSSTCSYHLRLLREAGVTRARAQGTQRLISLRREDLEARFPGLVGVLTR
jgi:DNA-binding transcriptional ArsR family regulator